MRVTIVGPNLPQEAKATFHVHVAGCADLERGWIRDYVQPEYTIDVDTALDVEADVYYFAPSESAEYTLGDYLDEFHFAPCLKDLP